MIKKDNVNIYQAFKAAKRGKRIRHKNWMYGMYAKFIGEEGNIKVLQYYDFDKEMNYAYAFTDSEIDGWEILD